MKVLLVYWHPEPRSFNAAMFHTAVEALQGPFAPDIEAELRKVDRCDLMIWRFPLWWFSLPAVLKGWVDRVFAMGRALLSLTTGGPEKAYAGDGFNGDLAGLLRPMRELEQEAPIEVGRY